MPKIAIIGTGLIGTSLGMALRQSDLRDLEVVGTDYDGRARSGAQKQGAFHKVEGRLWPAIEGADIVVLATPVMAMKDLFETIGPRLQQDAIVTDVGSSKRVVAKWAAEYLPPNSPYVGGHPMAGRETAGPENAAADLFPRQSVLHRAKRAGEGAGRLLGHHNGGSDRRQAVLHQCR